MCSPTGILSFSHVTVGAGTPDTSQARTSGLPATWLTVSISGFSNAGGTAGEKADCQNPQISPNSGETLPWGCLAVVTEQSPGSAHPPLGGEHKVLHRDGSYLCQGRHH